MTHINQRLENWARWAKSSSYHPSSCKSLESRYKSPQCWHEPEIKHNIDLLDALNVEHGLVSLPRFNMDLIVYSYLMANRNFDIMCRKLKIKGNQHLNKSQIFNIELSKSIEMLQQKLSLDTNKTI